MDPSELAALITKGRTCQQGIGLYRVTFAWVEWYAKRATVSYDENGDAQLVHAGPVAWDMSTVHADSPKLTMGEVFTGALCSHELQVLRTGRDDSGSITNPRWSFTVESVPVAAVAA